MKMKTQFEQLIERPEFHKLYAIEGLVLEASEFIARLMQEKKVTKAELARRLGRSRAYVTQMLSGSTNITVRTLAEVAYVLGAEVKLEAVPLQVAHHERPLAAPQEPFWKVNETCGRPLPADYAVESLHAAGRLPTEFNISYQHAA